MRRFARGLMAAGTTVAAIVLTASPAQASTDALIYVNDCSWVGCPEVGSGYFHADPAGSIPGDALQACDRYADGWGVITWMIDENNTVIREATTQGQDSPYCTPWQTGNLPEEKYLMVIACKIKGTTTELCESRDAWA